MNYIFFSQKNAIVFLQKMFFNCKVFTNNRQRYWILLVTLSYLLLLFESQAVFHAFFGSIAIF